MSDAGGVRLDAEESGAVCRAVYGTLVERHRERADAAGRAALFDGASDPAGQAANAVARSALELMEADRLDGAAGCVTTLRSVFAGVALVQETDFEAELGLAKLGDQIDGAGAAG